jgi:hypothetical protein
MFVVNFIRRILLFFLLFIVVDFNQVVAVNPSEEPLRSKILQGMEFSINNDFQAASNCYQDLIGIYPNHPIGYFYKGANIQAQMLDAEDYSLSGIFYFLMDKAIKLSDSLLQQGNIDPWILFYEGNAYLYKSFMKSKEGHWFSAYRHAKKGVHYLERSVKIDSLFFDAYLGIGSYKYWKSAKSSFLRWTPFIKDEREEGIELILATLNNGIFTQLVARDQLCWILIDKGDLEKAFNFSLENYRQYPKSRFIKWTLASAAFYFAEYEISLNAYLELYQEICQLPQHNHYNELDCLVSIAEIYAIKNDWNNAYLYSNMALQIKLDTDVRKRAESKLKKAMKIRTQVEKNKIP